MTVVPDDPKDPSVRVVDRRWWARTDNDASAGDQKLRKPTFVEDLERRLADQAAQLQTVLADHRRSLDDFEQAKLRIRRDVGRDVERAKRAVIGELLDVLDNLDRAIAAARAEAGNSAEGASSGLLRGVELVRDQFLGKLEAFGVTRISALGQPFDANRHEAVTTATVDDPAKDGTVVAVVREGYAIGDELLRPASVVVGKQ